MRLSRRFRLITGLSAAAIIVIGLWISRGKPGAPPNSAGTGSEPASGGKLVIALRAEPTSFDRLVASRASEQRVTLLTQSTLIRVNPVSHEIEPRLATSWVASPDKLTWTLKLRDGVLFSDGVPFTAADVVFTFDALYDQRLASDMASGYLIGGKPLVVRAIDDHTVSLTFPSPYGPAIRVLDGLPMLPQHKLAAARAAGTLRDAWGRSAPAADVVGLGPFVLADNTPGRAIRFTRNPHYWATDDRGRALPYLDEIDAEIVPSQDAEMLRLESGDLDVTNDFIRPEDIATLRDLASKGSVTLAEAGVGLDPTALWFDLAPQSKVAKARPWLQREEFRQAISLAVDRQAIVDSVYLGLAVPIAGPVTPGFGDWYSAEIPVPARDVTRAKTLLAAAGLTDRHGDGILEDGGGQPAHFTLLTQKGRTDRERTASLLASQLKSVGLDVDVVALDVKSLVDHLSRDDYDAIYYGPLVGSTDPAENLQFWLSSGSFHFWNLHEDQQPATQWERQIDDLMHRQAASTDDAERHRLFVTAQQVFADHMPALYFAAPKVTVAYRSRVHGVRASALQPAVLWNVEALSVSPQSASR
jgi:peptide/nickel transport system substrate-binding protein